MAEGFGSIAKLIRQARGYVPETDPSVEKAKSGGLRQEYGENAAVQGALEGDRKDNIYLNRERI